MSITCEITFDDPAAVYFSGQTISGNVKLDTTEVIIVGGILITINGFSEVSFVKGNDRFEAYKEYISLKTNVLGMQDGELSQLSSGTHEYTFSEELPLNLPPSFSGYHGQIKYEVVVTIDRGSPSLNNIFKQEFPVIKEIVQLSYNPILSQPKESEADHFYHCCCCGSGSVKMKLVIPFGLYIAGQKINYTLLIDNQSKYNVDYCEIEFTQRTSYHGRTIYTLDKAIKEDDQVIAFKKLSGVASHSKIELNNDIAIPLDLQQSFDSEIIKFGYLLVAEIKLIKKIVAIPIEIESDPVLPYYIDFNSVITRQPSAHSYF